MRLAIKLAVKAEGMTSPNPLVGAVIVKNGRVVGAGYHKRCGSAHAEVNAIKEAGSRARGATLYVTLEPCDHFGRTPPCTGAIVRSGIKSVVIGMTDPNPVNNGSGIRRLRKAGIKVTRGLLQKEVEAINRPYISSITKKLPYVTLKVAQSLDGKIATRTGDSKWISGEDSRRYVHRLRSRSGAVMVGAGTVFEDDPILLSKSSGAGQPVRIIVDGVRKIPRARKIFKDSGKYPVILASSLLAHKGRADLKKLLTSVNGMGINDVLVEGGGELASGLLEEGLVDRLLVFIAPKVIGGRDAITAVEGLGVARVADAAEFKITGVKTFSKDILIEAQRCSQVS
jgi:diaminohydroxyphosphoribosylaminopyrimidine deaminase/5-amino-6-(5-phosphoribosylamino)uracil reductase